MLRQLLKVPGVRRLWKRFPIGSPETRTTYDIWDRPHYAYGVLSAVRLCQALGLPGITVIEMGVAGGRGLLFLEEASRQISRSSGIKINVCGIDAGGGMPDPIDHRDLPHVWRKGFYRMDEASLRAKLQGAELIIGDVSSAVANYCPEYPLGFIAFDLDYYSSTTSALRIFDLPAATRLPRVYCYFDDVFWPERACHNRFTGELLAIDEFNRQQSHKKLCPLNGLRWMRCQSQMWNEQMYVHHDFMHEQYCSLITNLGEASTQKPL